MATKEQLRAMATAIHGRVCQWFPLFIVSGWRYKGFEPEEVGGFGVVVHLRFEKAIRGRVAFVEVQITEFSFNTRPHELKNWIIEQLHAQEAVLIEQRQRQLDCAAA